MIHYYAAGGTDTGTKRNCNQDSFGAKILTSCRGDLAAAIMCDGMGGYASGEVASATVVDAFQRWVLRRLPVYCENGLDSAEILAEWKDIVALCNRKIMQYGAERSIQLGTTAAMLLMTQEQYMILNVGDCRIYQIGETVRQITRDQTLVQREFEAGLLTEEQLRTDPRGHILAECIGVVPEVHPDIYTGAAVPDSVFMLCCDGFRHKISEAEMLSALAPGQMQSFEEMQTQIRKLIDMNMQQGETDNISVITIRTSEDNEMQPHPETAFSVLQEFCYTDSSELAE